MTRLYARLLVRLRFLVVIAWVLATAWAMQQPTAELSRHGLSIRDLAPVELPAVQAEIRAAQAFSIPLQGRSMLVQRDADGLTLRQQSQVVQHARSVPADRDEEGYPGLLGAVPVTNARGLHPGSRESDTTAITYLLFTPGMSATAQANQAQQFAAASPLADEPDVEAAVTGPTPARIANARIVLEALPRLEMVTGAAITVIVALFYRSLVAPLIVLASIIAAYSMSQVAIATLSLRTATEVPREVEPLLVALLLGVVTDYSLFFLSGMRVRLAAGDEPRAAATAAISANAPIVLTAGLTVGVGALSLVAAQTDFIRGFGPALAISVGAALVVSLTLTPALVAVLGRAAFWPRIPRPVPDPSGRRRVTLASRMLASPRASIAVALALVVAMAGVSLAALQLRLGYDVISALPATSEPARGQHLAEQGFAPGVIAPTTVLVEGEGLRERMPELARLQRAVARTDGVTGALGPATIEQLRLLVPRGDELPGEVTPEEARGIVVSPDGSSARILTVLDHDPYGGRAVETVRLLEERMPTLAAEAGLDGAAISLVGDTAVVRQVIDELKDDMVRVTLIVIAIDVVLLMLFLRAPVAALLVVGGSALALGAALGIATLVFQGSMGSDGLAFFVPLAVLVLLLSLGADYGVFSVGHIWRVARTLPLRQAIVESAGQTSSTVAVAGLVLAASFALLVVVPVRSFQEFAVAMSVGVLLDTFVIRPIVLPVLIVALGRIASWPNRHLGRHRHVAPATPPAPPGAAPTDA